MAAVHKYIENIRKKYREKVTQNRINLNSDKRIVI
jgi:hypothetical protein